MAQVLPNNQIKLDSGQVVQGQEGGWYNGSQLFGGSLSAPGVINSNSPQQGAGQAVSPEVIAQTNPANVAYVQKQQQSYKPGGISQPLPTNGGAGPAYGGDSGGTGLGITTPPPINLPQLYESLYASSGIRDAEAGLTDKTNQYNDAVSKIKNNPYLAEGNMTGRISKLDQKFAADSASIKNDIAMRKADVETRLNLQTKQYDINTQAAKQALDQFNSLLSAGALDSANGSDIASLTRSTGLSSNMIQSAIGASRTKNAIKPTMVSFDDGTNQGFAMVNPMTGEIIGKQIVARSKPTAASLGGTPGSPQYLSTALSGMSNSLSNSGVINSYGNISPQDWQKSINAWTAQGLDRADFVKNFGQLGDTNRGDFGTAYGFPNPTGKKDTATYSPGGSTPKPQADWWNPFSWGSGQ